MNKWLFTSVLLGAMTLPALAQDGVSEPDDEDGAIQEETRAPVEATQTEVGATREEQFAFVRIRTNAQEALVYADSTFVGRVAAGVMAVPARTSRIRLVMEDPESWSISPVEGALLAEPGDTVDVRLEFDYHYRIESMPFGADVHVERGGDRTLLGSTPLMYRTPVPLEGTLAIDRPGYAVERLEPGSDIWNRHVVTLNPSRDLEVSVASVDWRPPRKHRQWIDYAAVGTALAAGAIAIHYKFKADALYSEYEDTADPSLRPDIHAYDVRSGIAFGVMQAGISVFAVRLFLR